MAYKTRAHCVFFSLLPGLPAAQASWLFFEHIKGGSASESLRLLSLLPGKLPCSHGSLQPSFHSVISPFQKEFTWQPHLNCLPPSLSDRFPWFIFFHRIYHDLTLYFISTCVFFSTVSLTTVWVLLIPEFPLTCSGTRPWHRVGMQ